MADSRCCEHCPQDMDNVVTRTDLDDLRSELIDLIDTLRSDLEE